MLGQPLESATHGSAAPLEVPESGCFTLHPRRAFFLGFPWRLVMRMRCVFVFLLATGCKDTAEICDDGSDNDGDS